MPGGGNDQVADCGLHLANDTRSPGPTEPDTLADHRPGTWAAESAFMRRSR